MITKKQLQEDVDFLAKRSMRSSGITFGGKSRETGISSNSIVAIAYGLQQLKDQDFPSDLSDMESCERMWRKLPKHRKVGDAAKAMKAARNSDYYGKPVWHFS